MIQDVVPQFVVVLSALYCLLFLSRTYLSGRDEESDPPTTSSGGETGRTASGSSDDSETETNGTDATRSESSGQSDGGRSWWPFERLLRGLFALMGVTLFVATVAVLWRPALFQPLGIAQLSDVPELRSVGIQLLGAGALGIGALLFLIWHVLNRDLTESSGFAPAPVSEPPERSDSPSSPTPGRHIDEYLAKNYRPPVSGRRRNSLRDELDETATTVLVEYGDYDRAEAREQIETGRWTDDRRAADYLSDDDAVTPPWHVELLDWLRGEPRSRRKARHAIAALESSVDEATERDDG